MKSEFALYPDQHGQRPMHSSGKALVFIHGIFSSHVTFEELLKNLRVKGVPMDYEYWFFDYDFHRAIEDNARDLADRLKTHLGNYGEINLVGHSMGGLVARLAILGQGGNAPIIKRLIMLATPNHGTLHSGTLGLMAHISREATGVLWALTTRRRGLKDLTEIDKVLKKHLTDAAEVHSRQTDYVTIPAVFYYEGCGIFRAWERKKIPLGVLNLAFEFTELVPFWRVRMQKPHDGIVEESSVYLGAKVPTRFSERRSRCDGYAKGGPYLHVTHRDHLDADHMMVQGTERTAIIIAGILSASSLEAWGAEAALNSGYGLKPSPI